MKTMNRLTPLLKSFVEKGLAGCACTVVRNGETMYQECFGSVDMDLNNPITPDTIYRIYSMTKVVTCAAALMLYECGLFLLNDSLEEYLRMERSPHSRRKHDPAYGYQSSRTRSKAIATSGNSAGTD